MDIFQRLNAKIEQAAQRIADEENRPCSYRLPVGDGPSAKRHRRIHFDIRSEDAFLENCLEGSQEDEAISRMIEHLDSPEYEAEHERRSRELLDRGLAVLDHRDYRDYLVYPTRT